MSKSNKFTTIPDYGDLNNPDVRAKYGYLEATVSIIGNTLLFLIKLILGIFINSIALIADAVHTFSDVSTSAVVIFGFKISKKPSDKEHPFGHGRAEYVGTLIISVLLIVVGLGFIQQSIERIINNVSIINEDFAVIIGIIIIISAVIKEWMARFSFMLGKKINSDILLADAWHHRSDALASIAVGISLIATTFGFPILDSVFGIIVSIIIIYVGIDLMRKSSNFLLGRKVENETINQIEEIIKETKYAEGFHKIFLHDYGTSKIITLHLEIEPNLKIEQAHEIADILEEKIQAKTNFSTVIHLEPINRKINCNNGNKIIEKILKSQKEISSFHKIQIINGIEKDEIKMHLVVNQSMSVQKTHDLCHRIEKILQKEYGSCNIDIHYEPCDNNCKICNILCKKNINTK